MPDNIQKPKRGRPRRQWTQEQLSRIDYLAYRQSRDYTIAEEMDIPVMDFRAHFRKRCAQKRAEGKNAIYEQQFALKANPVMAIWLGKQHLEQTDKASVSGNISLAGAISGVMKDGKGAKG